MKFVLYTSSLNQEEHDVLVVPDIVRTARIENEKHHITGVLLFDGINFTQYLEGKDHVVDQLMQNILADKRHKNIVMILTGQLQTRLYEDWKMGYVDISDYADGQADQTVYTKLDIDAFKHMANRYTAE